MAPTKKTTKTALKPTKKSTTTKTTKKLITKDPVVKQKPKPLTAAQKKRCAELERQRRADMKQNHPEEYEEYLARARERYHDRKQNHPEKHRELRDNANRQTRRRRAEIKAKMDADDAYAEEVREKRNADNRRYRTNPKRREKMNQYARDREAKKKEENPQWKVDRMKADQQWSARNSHHKQGYHATLQAERAPAHSARNRALTKLAAITVADCDD